MTLSLHGIDIRIAIKTFDLKERIPDEPFSSWGEKQNPNKKKKKEKK